MTTKWDRDDPHGWIRVALPGRACFWPSSDQENQKGRRCCCTGLPPIIFPGCPERWRRDEALKAEADPPQTTLEQRHQAAGDILAVRCRRFFSTGVLFSVASHSPVETAQ